MQKSDHEPDLPPLVGPSQHMEPLLSVKDVSPRQPKMRQFRVVPPTPIGICLWYMRMDYTVMVFVSPMGNLTENFFLHSCLSPLRLLLTFKPEP